MHTAKIMQFYNFQTHFTFNICQRYICLYILQFEVRIKLVPVKTLRSSLKLALTKINYSFPPKSSFFEKAIVFGEKI
jgi:hypothetical protein